jgi:DNA-binding transcriptional MerR regulator
MLRHYHELGLLEPVDVDLHNRYRRYAPEQIVTAQIIRRFRDLDMPLEDIQVVLQAPDVETRNRVMSDHLARLESSLARTEGTVASLRDLLDRPMTPTSRSITVISPPRPLPSSRTLLTRPTSWPNTEEPFAKRPPRCPPRTSSPLDSSGASSTPNYSYRSGDGPRSSFHASHGRPAGTMPTQRGPRDVLPVG